MIISNEKMNRILPRFVARTNALRVQNRTPTSTRLATLQKRVRRIAGDTTLSSAADIVASRSAALPTYTSTKTADITSKAAQLSLLWTESAVQDALSEQLAAFPVSAIDIYGDGRQFMLLVVSDVFESIAPTDRRMMVKSIVDTALTSTARALPSTSDPPPTYDVPYDAVIVPRDVKLRTRSEHRELESIGHAEKHHVSYPFRRAYEIGEAGNPTACKALLARLGQRPGFHGHVGQFAMQTAVSAAQKDALRAASPEAARFDEGMTTRVAMSVLERRRREGQRF